MRFLFLSELKNPLLRRFWFRTDRGFGIGVTAYSIDDAKELIAKEYLPTNHKIIEVIEDIDIQLLDQNHVIANMGPPNFRGIWYPNLTL